MYNNYKDQTGRRSDSSYHDNPHEPPAVSADILKSNSAAHWNLSRLNSLPYGSFLGEQHATNQIIQDGHYSSCTNRSNSTNQRIIRPTARVNCQSNCNGLPYCNHIPRGPTQWNLSSESPGSVVCKTTPQFSTNDQRTSGRVAGNVDSGIDFSRYSREGGSTHLGNVSSYKDAVTVQERPATHMPGSEASTKKDPVYDCQVNLLPHQTSCKYPVPSHLPQPQPAGLWVPGRSSTNQPQTEFWTLPGESRRIMSMDGNPIQVPGKYWIQKKNEVNTNRHESSARSQDIYNYDATFQHQKRLEVTEKIKQFHDNLTKDQLEPIDWSHEAIRSSNIVSPYTMGRYPDHNRNNSHNSQAIGSHPSLIPLESYSHKIQTTYDSPQLHTRLTGHSAYPMPKVAKGSYFDPHAHPQPAHSASYVSLSLDNQSMHLNSGHSESVTTQAGARAYMTNMQSYLNPTLNNACNEMYANGNYGQSMQVVDNPGPAVTKATPTYERDIPHMYENILHQSTNNVASNMFYDNKMSKLNGYNPYYGNSMTDSLLSRNTVPFNMIPQTNLGIPGVKPQHPLTTTLKNHVGDSSQPAKTRRQLVEENLTHADHWATVTKNNEKAPILDVRHFLSTWDEDEESDLAQSGVSVVASDQPASSKQAEVFVLDCTNQDKIDESETRNTKPHESGVIHMNKADSQNSETLSSVIKPINDCQAHLELMHPKHKYHIKSIQEVSQPLKKIADSGKSTLPMHSGPTQSAADKIESKLAPLTSDPVSKQSLADTSVCHLDVPPKVPVSDDLNVVSTLKASNHQSLSNPLPTTKTTTQEIPVPIEQAADVTTIPKPTATSHLEYLPKQQMNVVSRSVPLDHKITSTQPSSQDICRIEECDSKPCTTELQSTDTECTDGPAPNNGQISPIIRPNSKYEEVTEIYAKLPGKTHECSTVIKYVASDVQNEDDDSTQSKDQELMAVDLSRCVSTTPVMETISYELMKEMPTLEPIFDALVEENESEENDCASPEVSSEVCCADNDPFKKDCATSDTSLWTSISSLKSASSSHTEIQALPDQSTEFELELHASYDGSYFRNDSSADDKLFSQKTDIFRIKSPNQEKTHQPQSLIDYVKCAEDNLKAHLSARKTIRSSLKLRSVRVLNRKNRKNLFEDNEKSNDADSSFREIKLSSPLKKEESRSTPLVSSKEVKEVDELIIPPCEVIDDKSTDQSITHLEESMQETNQGDTTNNSTKINEFHEPVIIESPDFQSNSCESSINLHSEPDDNTASESTDCVQTIEKGELDMKVPEIDQDLISSPTPELQIDTVLENKQLESNEVLDEIDQNESNENVLDIDCHESYDHLETDVSKEDEFVEETKDSDIPFDSQINVANDSNISSSVAEVNKDNSDESTEILQLDLNESQDDFDTSFTDDQELPRVEIVPEILDLETKHSQDTIEDFKTPNTLDDGKSPESIHATVSEELTDEAISEIDVDTSSKDPTTETPNEVDTELSSSRVVCDCNEDDMVADTVHCSTEIIEHYDADKSSKDESELVSDCLKHEIPILVNDPKEISMEDVQVSNEDSQDEKVEADITEEVLRCEGTLELDCNQTIDNINPEVLIGIDDIKVDTTAEENKQEKSCDIAPDYDQLKEEITAVDTRASDRDDTKQESCENLINDSDFPHTDTTIEPRHCYADEDNLGSQSAELVSKLLNSDTDDSVSSSEDSSFDVETVEGDQCGRYMESVCISQHSDSQSSDESDEEVAVQEKPASLQSLEYTEIANTIAECDDEGMPALEVITELPNNNSDLLEMPKLELMSADSEGLAVTDGVPSVEQIVSAMHSDEQELLQTCENMSWPYNMFEERPESANRIDLVHNWPYLEEEVFSETPRNQSPLIETTCSRHIQSPYLNSDSESEMPLNTSVPSQLHSIDSSSAENEVTNLKCRLSWDKIFNLSKTNGSRKRLNKTELARRWSSVKSKIGFDKNSPKKGFRESLLHDESNQDLQNTKGLELGPAKIQVRLTQKPLVPEQWQVINGPKSDSMSSLSFGEENNNISEFDSRSIESITGKSPIVLVKRIILKRRADDNPKSADAWTSKPQSKSRSVVSSSESDDSSLNQKSLPKVIIKRMGRGHTKYQSFLRVSENEERFWQPIVRLERSKSIENLVQKLIHEKNGKVCHTNELITHHHISEENIADSLEDKILESFDKENNHVSPDLFSHFSTIKRHSKEAKLSQTKSRFDVDATGINGKVRNGRIETTLVKTREDDGKIESGIDWKEEYETPNHSIELVQRESEVEISSSSLLPPRKKRVAEWKSEQMKIKVLKKSSCEEADSLNAYRATSMKSNQHLAVDKPPFQTCLACEVIFADELEKSKHIKLHSYHCQRCNMAFKSQLDFEVHLSATHPHTKELHHCLLCKLCFASAGEHQRHLAEREHRRLDLTQRWTIQRLFTMFSGVRCSRLAPFTEEEMAEMTTLTDAEPGAINYYHQATPLQLAEQDFRENVVPTIAQGVTTKSSELDVYPPTFEVE